MKKWIAVLCILTLLLSAASAFAADDHSVAFLWNADAKQWDLTVDDTPVHGASGQEVTDQIAALLDTKATEYDSNWDIYVAPNRESTYLFGLTDVTPLTRIVPMKDDSASALSLSFYLEPKDATTKAADLAAIASAFVAAYGEPDRIESYNYGTQEIESVAVDVTDTKQCFDIVPQDDTEMFWVAFRNVTIYITNYDLGVSISLDYDT